VLEAVRAAGLMARPIEMEAMAAAAASRRQTLQSRSWRRSRLKSALVVQAALQEIVRLAALVVEAVDTRRSNAAQLI